MTQHFFKVLTIFLIMIILGLIGVFVVNGFNKDASQTDEQVQVAK